MNGKNWLCSGSSQMNKLKLLKSSGQVTTSERPDIKHRIKTPHKAELLFKLHEYPIVKGYKSCPWFLGSSAVAVQDNSVLPLGLKEPSSLEDQN